MIGKVMVGKSFRGCLLYCLNDKQTQGEEAVMKNRAEVLFYHQCGGTDKEIIRQFNEVSALNSRLAKPVLHITLSFAPSEQIEREKLIQISEACAKEMSFADNQFVAVLHHDTKHQHLHLVANRIGFDGRTVSDSNSYKKVALFCRKMEQQHGLHKVVSPRRFLSKEERLVPRLDGRKEALKEIIKECLSNARNYEEFEGLMKRKKITIERGRGIAFIDEKKMRVKGSELGYSLQTIERIIVRKVGLIKSKEEYRTNITDNGTTNYNRRKEDSRRQGTEMQIRNIEKGLPSLLIQLTKQEENTGGPIAGELIREAKKKKRKGQRHS